MASRVATSFATTAWLHLLLQVLRHLVRHLLYYHPIHLRGPLQRRPRLRHPACRCLHPRLRLRLHLIHTSPIHIAPTLTIHIIHIIRTGTTLAMTIDPMIARTS